MGFAEGGDFADVGEVGVVVVGFVPGHGGSVGGVVGSGESELGAVVDDGGAGE